MSLFQHMAKDLPIWQRRCMSKCSCDICGCSKWMKCCKEHNHSNLPRLFTDNEAVDHVIHFPNQDVELFWYTVLGCLKECILRQHSAPVLLLAISDRLLHLRNWGGIHPIQRLSWKIQEAIDYHYLLGWDSF